MEKRPTVSVGPEEEDQRRCWDRPECRPRPLGPRVVLVKALDDAVDEEEEEEEESREWAPRVRRAMSMGPARTPSCCWAQRTSSAVVAAVVDEAAAAAVVAAAAAAAASSCAFDVLLARVVAS